MMFAMLAVLGAALAVAPAHAQNGLSVNVPFNFVVGKTTLRSGRYKVTQGGASFASFIGANGTSEFAMLFPGGDAHSRTGQPYLVFTRYGGESFLNKVVFSSSEVYDLPLSNREKELRAQLISGDEVAVLIEPAR